MPPTSDPLPRIGYTSREADIAYFHKFQHDYWFSILIGGGEPVRLYPDIVHDCDAVLDTLDGLVLTGGGDMDPALYGRKIDGTDANTIYPERDRMELGLTRAAVARDMPIFGVCRGIQVINVALGGTLTQHVEGHTGKNNTFAAPRPHAVNIQPGSLLDRTLVCGPIIEANSYHHQAVLPADLAPGLVITGQTADGVIEAMEHIEHPWLLGVQWHPERLYELCIEHRRLWEGFVEAARAYRDM
jgi:putative glutamine amidotransferase